MRLRSVANAQSSGSLQIAMLEGSVAVLHHGSSACSSAEAGLMRRSATTTTKMLFPTERANPILPGARHQRSAYSQPQPRDRFENTPKSREIPFDGDRYPDPLYLSGWSQPARPRAQSATGLSFFEEEDIKNIYKSIAYLKKDMPLKVVLLWPGLSFFGARLETLTFCLAAKKDNASEEGLVLL